MLRYLMTPSMEEYDVENSSKMQHEVENTSLFPMLISVAVLLKKVFEV